MTDREAIECMQYLDEHRHSTLFKSLVASEQREIIAKGVRLAISALQEREERSKGCRYCFDASLDPELEGCDLSYHCVGYSDEGYRFLVRAGNRKPFAILFERWNNDGWHTIGIYEPEYCPKCGRKLKGEQDAD